MLLHVVPRAAYRVLVLGGLLSLVRRLLSHELLTALLLVVSQLALVHLLLGSRLSYLLVLRRLHGAQNALAALGAVQIGRHIGVLRVLN